MEQKLKLPEKGSKEIGGEDGHADAERTDRDLSEGKEQGTFVKRHKRYICIGFGMCSGERG